MKSPFNIHDNGTITFPEGFSSGATFAGIKTPGKDKKDIGLLFSSTPCTVAGTYTQNSIHSPSVTLSKELVEGKTDFRGLVVNSGCANCAVGEQGYLDATETTKIAAEYVGVNPNEILIASTGVIGVELPMALIREYVPKINLDENGGDDFAKSILTTDTQTKQIAVSFEVEGKKVVVGGVGKGSGMIHPNMSTMLSFIFTDANIPSVFLRAILKKIAATTFNSISVDGDTSTNDMVAIFATGKAKNSKIYNILDPK